MSTTTQKLAKPYFVWMLAAFPVLHLAAQNPGRASMLSIFMALVAFLAIASVILLLARVPFSSWHRAALFSAVVLLVVILYGPLHSHIEESQLLKIERDMPADIPLDQLHRLLSLAAIVLIAVAALVILRISPEQTGRLTRGLNAMGAVLLALALVQVASASIRHDSSISQAHESGTAGSQSGKVLQKPDIYYIVLDGYARADVLEQHYGFDNGAFLDDLRRRGFEISDSSWANYNWTFLSLSSTLNFQYVHDIRAEESRDAPRDIGFVYSLIDDNDLARHLRRHGYRIVHLQSTWGATRTNPAADVEVPCAGGLFTDDFYRGIIEATWFKVLRPRASADLARCHLSNFDSLARLGDTPGPKFVFAHFVLPHHPYLFDHTGQVLRNATISDQFEFQKILWENKEPYIEQLRFVNQRVIQAVDGILGTSRQPPIIIVQSDHGPNLNAGLQDSERVRVRLANFAAYHLPGAPSGLMPRDGSVVNQFRRLLNHYFEADLPILPERHFWSDFRRPLDLHELEGVPSLEPAM